MAQRALKVLKPSRVEALLELQSIFQRHRSVPSLCFPQAMRVRHEMQKAVNNPLGGGYAASDHGGLHFGYTVPKIACTDPDGCLPLSALLTVIDETSTWAGMALDRHWRPGASVQLRVERKRLTPIQPGEHLAIVSSVLKQGKAMSFLAATVIDESGETVARGSHIKFLDTMPPGWNLLFGRAFGVTKAVLSWAAQREPAEREEEEHDAPLLPLLRPISSDDTGGSEGIARRFTAGKEHLNGLPLSIARMHGGCQAMVHEAVSREAVATSGANDEQQQPVRCEDIEVQYLSHGRIGEHTCSVVGPPTAGATAGMLNTSSRISDKRGAVVSEAHARFSAL